MKMIYYKEYKSHDSFIVGRFKKNKCDNNIYTFDIETTSYLKYHGRLYDAKSYEIFDKKEKQDLEYHSIMYIWMFGINDIVYYGRTWEELREFLTLINNNISEKKIIYIHNLAWEFQFLRSVFKFTDVFARTQRKVIKCTFEDFNFECRCSYMLSNLSLDQLSPTYNLPVEKLVGNLDYNIIRVPTTKLTDKELAYCENDCLVLYEYIKMELMTYVEINKIPMTSTGKVRKALQKLAYKDYGYRKKTRRAINSNPHIYNLLNEAYSGGYTHGSFLFADTIMKNVDSYDFCSSYPYVLTTFRYPMTEFIKENIKTVDDMYDLYAYLLVVRFYDIECKYYNNFISASKCRYLRGAVYDNGRLIRAKEIEMVLTDVDFYFILTAYDSRYEIIESYSSLYNYLPKMLINFILDFYVNKTKLKGISEKKIEYSLNKSNLNSIYGMCVTNQIRADVIYDDINGWEEKELTNEDIIERLLKDKKKGFLAFSWGCWCTSWARTNLEYNILKLDEYLIYSDTDSCKLRMGYDKNIIKNYNKSVKERIKYVSKVLNIPYEKYSPKDIKGEEHLLGVFECETEKGRRYTYDEFVHQGAKRYATKTDGKISITVAGVPKEKGACALKDLKDFKDNFEFKSEITGKQTLVYIDEQENDLIVDYQGNSWINTDKTGACLIPCSYVLNKSYDYINLICEESSKRAIYKED